MAREIYADPFGSYTRGYDTGVQREMSLQRGVRDARDTDWSYYNMKPLELETAQRNNAFQQFADPIQRQMLPLGYEMARANLFDRQYGLTQYPAAFGMAEPAFKAISGYFPGMPYAGTNQEGYAFMDASGQPIAAPQGAQGVLGSMPAMRAEGRVEGMQDWQRQIQAGQLDLGIYNAQRGADYNQGILQVQQQQAAAAAAKAGGGGSSFYNPSSWFGGAAAPAAPAPVAPLAPAMPAAPIGPAVPNAYTPAAPTAPMPTAPMPPGADPIAAFAQLHNITPQLALVQLAQMYNLTPEQVIAKSQAFMTQPGGVPQAPQAPPVVQMGGTP